MKTYLRTFAGSTISARCCFLHRQSNLRIAWRPEPSMLDWLMKIQWRSTDYKAVKSRPSEEGCLASTLMLDHWVRVVFKNSLHLFEGGALLVRGLKAWNFLVHSAAPEGSSLNKGQMRRLSSLLCLCCRRYQHAVLDYRSGHKWRRGHRPRWHPSLPLAAQEYFSHLQVECRP